ncbi:hypothetical protein [Microbacterium azadirachtae]|uniref:hypothetical protein n=1 Tax=Microbacterium azadirachtae TaxID=582680 RepID=UPI000A40BC52|nr:hypothetical protein [Microbacterium azadirachtae]
MDLNLNEAQLAVLRWIADGCDMEHPPSPNFKQSAISLRDRGLIELDRRKGHWTASLDPKGQFYLDHGHHPQAPAPPDTATVRKQKTASSADAAQSTPEGASSATADSTDNGAMAATSAKPPVKIETIPMPTEIGRAHPAIRELVKYRKRLDVPDEQHRRALLILHALVQESLRRGWTVTPQLSTMTPATYYTTRKRDWPSGDLFLIDAGHDPAAIRLRMKTRRVDHVLTEKEREDKQRGRYSYPPKYDYVDTDKMRLEVGAGRYGSLVLEDTVATRIEDKLLRALERVQQLSDDAVARAEAQRLREIEAAKARERAEALRVRALAYGHWREKLLDLAKEHARHQALVPVVAKLRETLPQHQTAEYYDQLTRYVEWAEQYLTESDPFASFPLPRGDRPDLSYQEWREWDARNPQRW